METLPNSLGRRAARTYALALLLSAFLLTLLLPHQAFATGAPYYFTPTADAMVDSVYPDANYGSETSLQALAVAPDIFGSYLQFDLSSVPDASTILSASLSMYCYDTIGASQASLYHGNGDSWSELSLTWNNQPGYDTGYLDSQVTSSGAWTTWDLLGGGGTWNYSTDLADNILTLYVGEQNLSAGSAWRSKEYSDPTYRPVLTIIATEAPTTYSKYDFTFTYSNGDYYTGSVYAQTGYNGYAVGYTQNATVEGSLTGTYEITGATTVSDGSQNGQVFVDNYYNQESASPYTPMHTGSAVGTNYLGTESDYILKDGVTEYLFGTIGGLGLFYEADLVSYAYGLTFNYAGGDFYSGYVFAAPEYGYYAGYTQSAADEYGQTGSYSISWEYGSYDFNLAGQVWVNDYYDHESDRSFTPIRSGSGTAAGANYLGSESDYIIEDAVPSYAFGFSDPYRTYEADLITLMDLGTLGYSDSYALDINDLGQIVGYYTTTAGYDHAFLYDPVTLTMTDLDTLGGDTSYAYGINNLGQIVGFSITDSGQRHAFLYDDVYGMQDLGTLGGTWSEAFDINDLGQIVGDSTTTPSSGDSHAFLYDPVYGMQDLGTLGGDTSYAYGINEQGQVVGYSQTEDGNYHAFLYDSEAGMHDLGTLGGGSSYALIINEQGQVVGYSTTVEGRTHACLFIDDETEPIIDLGTLGGNYSFAHDINDQGQIVGDAYTAAGDDHAFLYDISTGTMTDLGTLGGDTGWAESINDLGQIVGNASTSLGQTHAFAGGTYRYDFTFTYANGDYYTGSVYAIPGHNGYDWGYTQEVTDENDETGTYEITGVYNYITYSTPPGQVYVNNYYDSESGQDLPTLNWGSAVGDNYLGSESDYIVVADAPAFMFGYDASYELFREADLWVYNPDTGSYYSVTYDYGFIGYSDSWVASQARAAALGGNLATVNDSTENDWLMSQFGSSHSYYIGLYQTDRQAEPAGHWAWVSGEPVSYTNWDTGVGEPNNYDGNEDYGYLNWDGAGTWIDGSRYAYGTYGLVEQSTAAPAATGVFDFTLHYADGDYYTGQVYAPVDYGYYLGATINQPDENVYIDYYEITGVSYITDSSQEGQVYVNYYYDHENDAGYTPLNSGTAVGFSYLASEYDYIISEDSTSHLFGMYDAMFYEADVVEVAYEFTYSFYNEGLNPIRITHDSLTDFYPSINDQGQAVWFGWDGDNYEIYLYSDGMIRPLTHEGGGHDNLYPWINNTGQVVWSGWEGSSLEIYLYDLNTGVKTQLTDDIYNDYFPMINDSGQITWLTATTSENNQSRYLPDELTLVKAYDAGTITSSAFMNYTLDGVISVPVINSSGQIVFSGWEGYGNKNIYSYDAHAHTTTKLTGGDGDTNPYINDTGQIAFVRSDGNDNEIFLYDQGSIQQITFNNVADSDPVINNAGQIAWTTQVATGNHEIYWGQDGGDGYYIHPVTNNSTEDQFPHINQKGQIVWTGANEIYLYNTIGDYYTGRVIVSELDDSYGVGDIIYPDTDLGFYRITGIADYLENGVDGQVYVDNYYDFESLQTFTPVNSGTPVGLYYLESESDAILTGGDPAYNFNPYAEADVLGIGYNFTYFFGNGDYYSGTVYAPPDYGYQMGYWQSVTDENNQQGYYTITGVDSYTSNIGSLGQVFVDAYFDIQSMSYYTPVHSGAAAGDAYLGSERDFIREDGVPQYYFGAGYYEASVFQSDTFLYKEFTNNSYDNPYVRMNGLGQVVYTEFDGNDYEIFLNVNGTVTQITNNSYDDDIPVIWGDRQVTWSGFDGTDWEIFLYNNGTTTQITDNSYDDGHSLYTMLDHEYYYGPVFNGQGKIVWSGGPANNHEIYVYTISTGLTQQITNNSYNDDYPKINYSGQLIWTAFEPGDQEIFFYDPGTGYTTNISNNDTWDSYVKFNDRGQIVWTSGPQGSRQIYLYDDGVTSNISNNAYDNLYGVINNAGMIAWCGFDGTAYQVYTYVEGTTKQITQGTTDTTMVQIFPTGELLWNGFDGEHWQVYLYTDGAVHQITHSNFDVLNYTWVGPGGPIAWSEYDGHDWEIYRAVKTPSYYTTDRVTDFATTNSEPIMSNGGQMVWWGSDASGINQIYLYDGVTVQQITSGTLDSESAIINAQGQITWSGYDGNDWEVFLYDNGVITQLTNNAYDDGRSAYTVFGETRYHQPIINVNGDIVWAGGPDGNKEIYLYHNSLITQITSNSINDDYPMMNNAGEIAWVGGPSGNREIYFYDGTIHQITNNAYDDVQQRINNNGDLTYIGYDGTDWELWLYSGGTAYQVTNNSYNDLRPRFNDSNQIVWQGWDGHDFEIFKYDGAVYQLTHNNYDDLEPRINNQGQVVWQGYNGQDWDVYLYDDGAVSQLSRNSGNDIFPRINNLGQVSWEGRDADGNSAIYVAVPTAGTRTYTQITNNNLKDSDPDLAGGGQLVWRGWDGHDYEIYYYDGTTYQITNNDTDDVTPRLNNQGDIVWNNYYSQTSGPQVMHYNVYVGGTPTVVGYGWAPDINDSSLMVYKSIDIYGNTFLYLWDAQAGQGGQIPNSSNPEDYRINNLGQVVWASSDGLDEEIYLYTFTATPGVWITRQITDNAYSDISPRINDHGQITWSQNNGDGWDTYLYSGGVISQVVDTIYDNGNSDINNFGSIVFLGSDGHDLDVYLQLNSEVLNPRTSTGYDEDNPVINDSRQIAYIGNISATNQEIFLSTLNSSESARYSFTFHYASGDYYTGTVYAPLSRLYEVGYKFYAPEESGSLGYYEITAAYLLLDDSRNGQVLVDAYYDAQSGNAYLPLNTGAAVGTDYLGSETDYIISSGEPTYYFGEGYWEANASEPPSWEARAYDFTFTYGNGDYYTGTVYGLYDASGQNWDQGYQVGWTLAVIDEHGLTGQYEITGYTSLGQDDSQRGNVYVDQYYDKETNTLYTPVNAGTALTSNFLTYEFDYIISYGELAFYFAGGYYEADWWEAREYTYTFTYGNGDYYTGTVYGRFDYAGENWDQGYQVGWTLAVIDEHGLTGQYEITGYTSLGLDDSQRGKVYVDEYYDQETETFYTPVNAGTALTSNFLTYEFDYIISYGEPAFYFAGGYYEADWWEARAYDFNFTYGNGDYYTGTVYGRFDYAGENWDQGYQVGWTLNTTDEHGLTGQYEITGYTSLGLDDSQRGYVYVDQYYDQETNTLYTPVNAGTALTSDFLTYEFDYIISYGEPAFYFAGGYYEADWWEAREYTYTFTYGNGDYYTGTVYGRFDYAGENWDQGYQVGWTLNTTDEHGLPGQYRITGFTSLGLDDSQWGSVYVDQYYDFETDTLYTPVNNGNLVGGNFLGIEYDYIIIYGEPAFYFGNGYYEADWWEAREYTYTFTYGNGDYYTGTVYGRFDYAGENWDQGYNYGWNLEVVDEHGLTGQYQITGYASLGLDDSQRGHVYVDEYYDQETETLYTPVNAGTARTSNFLTYEFDYIISSGEPAFYFAGGYYEADWWEAREYTYTFTYGNGDYYTGSVYGRFDYAGENWDQGYQVGWTLDTTDEHGLPGQYRITGFTSLGLYDSLRGFVYINEYYDKETNTTYVPVNAGNTDGLSYLSSEYDYIISYGEPAFLFGGGTTEADWWEARNYTFTFTYGNGDYYTGRVYGRFDYAGENWDQGYQVGWTLDTTDENDLPGQYQITGYTSQGLDDSQRGQVYVDQYYDFETDTIYTPVSAGSYLTSSFLTNEYDYIIQYAEPDFFFGGGTYEADGITQGEPWEARAYDFTFTYGNGDYYTGTVYGLYDPSGQNWDQGYQVGWTLEVIDEHGLIGQYQITGYTSLGLDDSQRGNVYVNHYYDFETNTLYIPVNAGTARTSNFLTYEFDYIISSGEPAFYFAGGYYEADWWEARAYDFTFTYGNGDYYTGTVYGRFDYAGENWDQGYNYGWNLEVVDEHGLTGQYQITGYASLGLDDSQRGHVYVEEYYDQETETLYTPVNAGTARTSNFLTYEFDYIISSGEPAFYFAGGYYEADWWEARAYDFTFTYGNGDYYTGTVYGRFDYAGENWDQGYNYGWNLEVVDEHGLTGQYQITGYTSLGQDDSQRGQVYVDEYYDQETETLYTPVNAGTARTSNFLTYEFDYIISSGEPAFYFAGGYYEADWWEARAYDFTFTYGNGDYYTGTVYGRFDYAGENWDQGYQVDWTLDTADEHDLPGQYRITGYTSLGLDDSQRGHVYVDEYYDFEMNYLYSPVSAGTALTANFLGTEFDYIISYGEPAFMFGGGTIEADWWETIKYNFTFTYGNGDYYTGTVYGRFDYAGENWDQGYQVSWTLATTDEHGLTGQYQITGYTSLGLDDSQRGNVYVDEYYDQETDTLYTPVNTGYAVGSSFLGTEYDYIISYGEPAFSFGGGYYEADLDLVAYAFQFTYGNGDYYTGTVYAAPEYGYSINYTQTLVDENNLTGTYEITGTAASGGNFVGQVYVTSYYDSESGQTFDLTNELVPLGSNYLGSESDSIIMSGVPEYYYGNHDGTFYEADLVAYAYAFTFTYNNGDYYTGSVYAAPEYGYSTSYTWTTTAENGQSAMYAISAVSGGYDFSLAGQVYVDSYYDYASGTPYTPVSTGAAVGLTYLTSEYDYIIQAGIPEYYFGGGYYEADVKANRYDFYYSYYNGSGDNYYGYVYAPADYGYSVGYTLWTQDETGYSGYYYIYASENAAVDYTRSGQVFVTSYYDAESGVTYTPVSTGAAVGLTYLTSEYDYIIQADIPPYYFGGGYYEADAQINRYDFYYSNYYGSGDYYYGYVYAPADYGYSVGYTLWTQDETGYNGYYYIYASEGATVIYTDAGQVYVTLYYDAESGATYTPVSTGTAVGVAYLTSEHDYIIQAGIPEYYFGGGYYEADKGSISRYDFIYCYSNGNMDYYTSGDYYTGYFFAPTSFQTSLNFAVGTNLYDQPMELWSSGYKTLNGGYYSITAINDGFPSSFDKKSYITAYYDMDGAKTNLGVNTDGSPTVDMIYVPDRTFCWEAGYAINGSQYASFDPYSEVNVTTSTSSTSNPSADQTLAVWAAYWSSTDSQLEE
ncbi:MAG: DNRLRE domain-containing protein [Thermodesulfobacteriota bacterium]